MSTLTNGTIQTFSGYTCSCGIYVPAGQAHTCWNLGTYQWPTYVAPTTQTVQRFRGSVEAMDKLPKGGYSSREAKPGDAYYVTDLDALVVRTANGWLHLDRE